MNPDLIPRPPVPNPPAPGQRTARPAGAAGRLAPADRARVTATLEAAHADNTTRTYRAAWKVFEIWMARRGYPTLPAEPVHVASYLTSLAARRSIATVQVHRSAIASVHRQQGLASPCAAPGVKRVLQGLANTAARLRPAPRQADALTSDALAAIRAAVRRQEERELSPAARRRCRVDLALVHVLSDAGLRRAEAAALRWRDLTREGDGSGRVYIARSKSDPAGEGAVVAITRRAMDYLDAIREGAPGDALVFALGGRQLARRVKAAAAAAGLGGGFSGHSGRVGMARRMIRNGAPTTTALQQGRWKEVRMLARYTRNESAGAALAFLVD